MKIVSIHRIAILCLALLISISLSPVFAEDDPLKGLSDKFNVSDRTKAVEKLLDMGPDVIPLFLKGIKHKDTSIKVECIGKLGQLKVKEAVPDLLQILKRERNLNVISVTVLSLGFIQDKRATPELIEFASSNIGGEPLKKITIAALGLLGDSSAMPFLEKLLEDKSEAMQLYAAGFLGLMGSKKGLDIALKAINSNNITIRNTAVQSLGYIGSKKALETLKGLIEKTPDVVDKSILELAIFKIDIKGLSKKQKIAAIKKKILLSQKSSSNLINWGMIEIIRINDPAGKAALDEIAKTHSNQKISANASINSKILKIIAQKSRKKYSESQEKMLLLPF